MYVHFDLNVRKGRWERKERKGWRGRDEEEMERKGRRGKNGEEMRGTDGL